jgi:hypothetical protein
MKLLITVFLFATQLTHAQIGTSGGFQTPIQMGISSTAAVLKSVNTDFGLTFWTIKRISIVNFSKVQVEFLTEVNTCEAVLYNVTMGALDDGYQAKLDKSAKVSCSR